MYFIFTTYEYDISLFTAGETRFSGLSCHYFLQCLLYIHEYIPRAKTYRGSCMHIFNLDWHLWHSRWQKLWKNSTTQQLPPVDWGTCTVFISQLDTRNWSIKAANNRAYNALDTDYTYQSNVIVRSQFSTQKRNLAKVSATIFLFYI